MSKTYYLNDPLDLYSSHLKKIQLSTKGFKIKLKNLNLLLTNFYVRKKLFLLLKIK